MTNNELRRLDAWIDKHVMSPTATLLASVGPEENARRANFVAGWVETPGSCPGYTTDGAAALLVLGKCAEREGVTVRASDRNTWVASVTVDRGGASEHLAMAEAETLPLAVCLLATEMFGG